MKQTAIIATTHLDLHFQRFTRGALEDCAEEINGDTKPLLTVEHDLTIPPFGKMTKAWIELREDGEYQLVAEQEIFEESLWAELEDGTKIFKQESEIDHSPFADRYGAIPSGCVICYDPMNFESQESAQSFITEVRAESGEEFSISAFGRKSLIPDPEIIVRLAETVTTYLIASKILQTAGNKVIELAAEDIAKFYSFVKSLVIAGIKYAIPKGRPVTYIFVMPGHPTIEFIARSTVADVVISAMVLNKLEESLAKARDLRDTFSAAKIQYLLNNKGEWEFNYLLTDTGAVIGTEKSFSRRTKRIELLNKATTPKPEQASMQSEENHSE